MFEYYITFRSLTSAQQAAFVLNKNGIHSLIKRVPAAISVNGCGYSLVLAPERGPSAVRILRELNIKFEKIYQSAENHRFREGWL